MAHSELPDRYGEASVAALAERLRAAAPPELGLDGPPDADLPDGFGHRGLDAALAKILAPSNGRVDGDPSGDP